MEPEIQTPWPWRWRHCGPSKCQELLTEQMASHPRRPESAASLLWVPQTSHFMDHN